MFGKDKAPECWTKRDFDRHLNALIHDARQAGVAPSDITERLDHATQTLRLQRATNAPADAKL